ncbi:MULTISPECIES: hypothetical protein [unclassified Actinobaculum]|uniref:hypothetical protein n=1 Tax=unclassified Actinobaculum TaxID=2609299 RepID=UPI000F7F16EA|nr:MULTISPECIES: hypothetical protein [unclassified Actinobaculum]RTE50188.1 hypothetical protein EKN07_02925 [Actinobaculum sp. 352]
MSFMIVAGGFHNGEVRGDGKADAYEVLRPYIVEEDPQPRTPRLPSPEDPYNVEEELVNATNHLHLHLKGPEIKATIGLFEDSMTAERFGGDRVCDLLVEAARAANWVIIAPGSPTCITRESQRKHLPPDLAEHVALVASGYDLIEAFDTEV